MIAPLVLVTADLREVGRYRWHMTPTAYVDAVANAAKAIPLILPALGERLDIAELLTRVDGVLVTGSASNVHPSEYGIEPTPDHEPYDRARDATTLPLIRAAIDLGVPLLAICRGFQELNVALGGSLHTEIQTLPGRLDHRSPEHDDNDVRFAIRQPIRIERGGCLGRILGADEIVVNSLHRQGVATLAPRLEIEAVAPDGTIEAVSVTGARGFALGVQWHPEYWATSDAPSQAIFAAFERAVCERARERHAPVLRAAE